MNSNPTQADKILNLLRLNRSLRMERWVPMPELARESGAYAVHSRIAELRRRGHRIENRIKVAKSGVRESFYRLEGAQ